MSDEEILHQLRLRLNQLEVDERQIKVHLSTKIHPQWFTDYLLDMLSKIMTDKIEIQNKIDRLEKNL